MCFLFFSTIYFDFTVHEGAFKLLCKNSMLERNNLYCLHLLTSDCSDLKFIPTHVAKEYKNPVPEHSSVSMSTTVYEIQRYIQIMILRSYCYCSVTNQESIELNNQQILLLHAERCISTLDDCTLLLLTKLCSLSQIMLSRRLFHYESMSSSYSLSTWLPGII